MIPRFGYGGRYGLDVENTKGHTNYVFCVNYNNASNLLVSGGCDGEIRVWNVDKGKCLKKILAHLDYVTAVHFNRDASLIVSCSLDGLIRIWNTATGQCLKTLAESHDAICQHVQFSPNSKYILSTAHDSAIRLWDYQTSRCLKTEDHKVYLWDLQSREIVQTLEGHTDVVVAVATHPQQNMIASGSIDSDLTIRIWADRGGS
ncbi:WD40-repeat-containing domain protein [Trametes punicea]|nr:WD40-repeat-containing domain protein [Trametes punicea]